METIRGVKHNPPSPYGNDGIVFLLLFAIHDNKLLIAHLSHTSHALAIRAYLETLWYPGRKINLSNEAFGYRFSLGFFLCPG